MTVAVEQVSRTDALLRVAQAADPTITRLSASIDDEPLVSFAVHAQRVDEVIAIIFGDQLGDISIAVTDEEISVEASRAARARQYRDLRERYVAQDRARRGLASVVATCDSIEISVLGRRGAANGFPIAAYESRVAVVGTVNVAGDQVAALRRDIVAVLKARSNGAQALCHEPGYGLRCFRGGALVMEASFCWACNNYHLVLAGEPSFISLPTDGTGDALKARLLAMAGAPPPE